MIINGGWVFLQNLHLLKAWTNGYLEDTVENISKAHETFRLFLSTEPSFAPIAILKSSIKLANEAPDGLQANILKAMQPFDDTFFEQSNCPSELKAVMFGICMCHAVLVQRKTFGPIGAIFPMFVFFSLFISLFLRN
jgi:dynein heavy chain